MTRKIMCSAFTMMILTTILCPLASKGQDYVVMRSWPEGPGFWSPMRIALDGSGNMYVADTDNGRIMKLSPSGDALLCWGSRGTDDGQIHHPSGIAVDSWDNVYVAGTWTQKADMPTARYIPGSAVVDGKIYVIGGAPVRHGVTATVEEYDPATNTWTRRADMPTARRGVVAATVDGIIYAIGGWAGLVGERAVEAYDPATDKWTKKADMPTSRILSAIAVVDGRIYVIGGQDNDAIMLSVVEAYDPATGKWTKKADMPTARYHIDACVVDGRIYVFGGATKFGGFSGNYSCVPTVEIYDPATDTWSQASDMPWTRYGYSASVVAGKMYIIGGWNEEVVELFEEGKLEEDEMVELLSPVDVYDPETDTWTTAADFPFPRGGHTAAVVDGKIYTIGGSRGGDAIFSTVEEFDPGLPDVVSSVSPAEKGERSAELQRKGRKMIEIIKIVGTSAVTVVALYFLLRTFINTQMEKVLEEYKTSIKMQMQEVLEGYKIGLATQLEDYKLRRIHQLTAYSELCYALSSLQEKGNNLWESVTEENINEFRTQLARTRDVINKVRPYISRYADRLESAMEAFSSFDVSKTKIFDYRTRHRKGYPGIDEIGLRIEWNRQLMEDYNRIVDEIAWSIKEILDPSEPQ